MTRAIAFLIVVLVMILNSPGVAAQTSSEIHFTEDDGLPGNQVMDVLKDRKGILRVATNNGVARYDGDEFTHINDLEGKPFLMARALECGEGDTIYAGSNRGGLAIIKNDSIRRIIHNGDKTSDRIRKLYYSEFYHILVAGTENGLFILYDSAFVHVPLPVEKEINAVVTSICGRDSLIYFTVADRGIFRLLPGKSGISKPIAIRKSVQGSYSCLLSGNQIYTSRHNLLNCSDLSFPAMNSNAAILDESFFIWCLEHYKSGEILIGGIADERFRGAVMVYNPQQNSFQQLINDGNAETVNSIYYDSDEDIVWIARDNGLTAVFKSPFEYIPVKPNVKIIDLGFAGDSLLVLTPGGILMKKDKDVLPLISRDRIMKIIDAYFANPEISTKPYLLDNKTFRELVSFENSGKRLFVSTQRGAISVPDLKEYLPFAAGTFHLQGQKSAYSQVKYMPLRFFPSYKDSISWIEPKGHNGTVREIEEIIESGGICYCRSLSRGLYVIKGTKVFRLSDENSEIDNYLTDMDEDPEGNIWCASGSGTLFKIGFSDSAFVKSTKELLNDGYYGNECRWIKFSGKYLYMGTNKGLSIISRSQLDSEKPAIGHSYNEYNGFGFTSTHSPATDSNGKVYLHNEKGIIIIDTVFRSSRNGKLWIEKLIVNGRGVPVPDRTDLNLGYNKRQVAFSFHAVKYPSSRYFRYRYKVNSDAWISGNNVLLQSLRPGRYEISIEGLNTEDMSTIGDSIAFSVRPPFWWSAWFIALLICVFTLLFYYYLRLRLRRLSIEHEERTKLVIQNSELQLRSLQMQMNPHFIFNSLNAIQAFIMEKNTEDSLKYLNDLSGIIRTNLENATEEYIFLSREIEFLKKYVRIEDMRFNNKLNVKFIEKFSKDGLMMPPMLIQPVIENAIKHGIRNVEGKGRIIIMFSQEDDILSVTVEDNGAGRKFSKAAQHNSHKGLSLNIIKQRLDLLNRKYGTDRHTMTITDLEENGVSAGTRVVINVQARS